MQLSATAEQLETLSDEALVPYLARGDTQAFRLIMKRHNSRLFRLARGMLGDDGEAEDAVQEAYVRAFRNIDRFRGEARFSTWLTRIALNEAFDRRRRQRPFV